MTEAETSARPDTPWHLWLIGIVGTLWNLMGAYDYLMTQTENEAYMSSFTPEQLEFFYGFPAWLATPLFNALGRRWTICCVSGRPSRWATDGSSVSMSTSK